MNKIFTISALVLALSACNTDPVNESTGSGNSIGSVALSDEMFVGETITATVTDADGVDAANVVYAWLADNAAIDGEGSTYLLKDADAGKMISVSVTYTDNKNHSELAKSDPSREIEVPATNTSGSVAITGTTTSGQVLTATVTDDNGFDASTVTYQWMAGTDNVGAGESIYLLTDADVGKTVTVSVMYSDNDAFEESFTSEATLAIAAKPAVIPPQVGDILLSGSVLLGETLTASVNDVNGIPGAITYVWKEDGLVIADASAATFVLTAAQLGKVVSVMATYTDGDGAAESLMAETSDRVYSIIVSNEAELIAAVAGAVANDWIALATASGGDYADMADIEVSQDGLVLTNTVTNTAVISGATCITLTGTGTTIDGLTFKDSSSIPSSACDGSSSSDAMIKMDGEEVVIRNSTFDGYVGTVGFNLIEVKGEDNIIERNVFKNLDSTVDKSGAISIYTDTSDGSKVNTTVQYNLFKDMPTDSADRKSGAYVIQVGRSTGNDATLRNMHKILHNRFDGVEIDERLIKVQSSETTIKGNTIVNSTGMISVENGGYSVIKNNIIIPTGTDSDDGGIAFVSMGHTIANNYISNVRTTSGGRGAIFTHTDKTDDDSNQTILGDNAADLTVLVSDVMNNTILNAREGINLDEKDCDATDGPRLNYASNLIANETGNDNAASSKGVLSVKFDAKTCAILSLTSTNNHIYANDVTDGGDTAALIIIDGTNVTGAIDGATLTAANTDGLVSGSGVDAGFGADTTKLHFILESEVGPNSTWVSTVVD